MVYIRYRAKRIARIYGRLQVIAVMCILAGCRTPLGGVRGVSRSVTLPLLSFVQSPAGAMGSKGGIVLFPALEVFDSSGALVYTSHDASANAAVLNGLPGSLASFKPISGGGQLSTVTERLAGLNDEDRRSLLESRLPTVVSVSLDGCEGCSVQEEAVGRDTDRLLAHGVNTLVIRVSR